MSLENWPTEALVNKIKSMECRLDCPKYKEGWCPGSPLHPCIGSMERFIEEECVPNISKPEIKMLTAKEAKDQTQVGKESIDKIAEDEIMAFAPMIKEAAARGNYKITILANDMPEHGVAAFRRFGYKVERSIDEDIAAYIERYEEEDLNCAVIYTITWDE